MAVDDDLLVNQQHLLHHRLSAAQHHRLQTGGAAHPLSLVHWQQPQCWRMSPHRTGSCTRWGKSRTEKDIDGESLNHKQDAKELSVKSPIKWSLSVFLLFLIIFPHFYWFSWNVLIYFFILKLIEYTQLEFCVIFHLIEKTLEDIHIHEDTFDQLLWKAIYL